MLIFISYSSKDRDSVKSLAEDLESLGHKVWFDQDLSGGQAWWDTIIEQILACDLFIVALTPSALDSIPCRLEYSYAGTLAKRILPVMLVDVHGIPLPSGLTRLQYVDYRQRDANSALKLARAFNLLPPAKPLPDVLPSAPEAPISPLSRLRDQLDQSSLGGDEQILILAKLKDYLDDDFYAADARFLLERLRDHPNLLARNEREIAALLTPKAEDKPAADGSTPPKPPARKSAGRRATRPLRVFSGHTNSVHGARFSPDGERVLTCSEDKTARLWHLASDESILLEHAQPVTDAGFSPDGNSIATCVEGGLESQRDGTITLWTITGEVWYDIQANYLPYSLDYSPDGKRLVVVGRTSDNEPYDGVVAVYDIVKGENIRQVGSPFTMCSAQFSPNGSVIAAGETGGAVHLLSAATGKNIRTISTAQDSVLFVAYSPDGSYLLTGGKGANAQLWQVSRALAVRSFDGHTDTINGVAYSPDGRYVLTGSSDTTARVWDAATGQQVRSFPHPDWVHGVAFSPDGKTILTGCADNNAYLWESGV